MHSGVRWIVSRGGGGGGYYNMHAMINAIDAIRLEGQWVRGGGAIFQTQSRGIHKKGLWTQRGGGGGSYQRNTPPPKKKNWIQKGEAVGTPSPSPRIRAWLCMIKKSILVTKLLLTIRPVTNTYFTIRIFDHKTIRIIRIFEYLKLRKKHRRLLADTA